MRYLILINVIYLANVKMIFLENRSYMKISLQKQQLTTALTIITKAIGSKKDGKVLIEYKNNYLHLTAFDMLEVSCKIPRLEGEKGKAALSIQSLLSIIKTAQCNREVINISTMIYKSLAMVEITFANEQSVKLPNLVDEFDIEKSFIKKPKSFSISAIIFHEMLFNTRLSMANNDIRYYLNGARFSIEDGKVSLASSDGRRISISESSITSEICTKLIIPHTTITALSNLVKPNNDLLKVQFNKKTIQFKMNELAITSELIDEPEEYPDLESFFSKQEEMTHIRMRKELLMQFLLQISRDKDEYPQAYFRFSKSGLSVKCYNKSETIIVSIPLEGIKEDILISFNPNYLLDVIKRIPTTSFTLVVSDPRSAAIITYSSLSKNKFCIMPISIKI